MENKEDNLLCMACLCVGRNIRKVVDEQHKKFYLDALNELPLNNMNIVPRVCWECDATLGKVLSFREQVKDCFRILQTCAEDLHECSLLDISRPPRLKVHINSTVTITPGDDSVKPEFEDQDKKEKSSENCKIDISDKRPIEDIQTVLCDVKRDRRKKKINEKQTKNSNDLNNTSKNSSKVPRPKRTTKKDIDPITVSDNNQEDFVKVEIDMNNRVTVDEGVKTEIDNDGEEHTLSNEASLKSIDSDNDTLGDIDTKIQTFLDNIIKKNKDKSTKVKKKKKIEKNTSKNSSKVPRPKRTTKKDIDPITVSDNNQEDFVKVEIDMNNRVTVDEGVKTEIDNDGEEHTLSNEASLKSIDSDNDTLGDIDTKIQTFLDDIIKKNKDKSTKVKKKKKIEKVSKSQNILTVDLSYDEMQSERSLLSRRESYVQAQYKCDSCLLVFNCSTSLQTHHMKKHKVAGDHICSICQTIVSSVEAFTAHYKRHMRRYECAICHKRSTDIKSIQQHLYTRHQITLKKYKCKSCGKVSKSLDKHRYHCDKHKSRVQCPQCDKTFSHRAGLMNHRLAVHEARNQFPCALCDKVFRWKTSLKRHLDKHNTQENNTVSTNKAYCEACDIGFSSVCSLQRHLRNSLKHVTYDQLKFICDHCDHRFVDKTKLRDHIEEKHLYRTFHCHICHKPSKNRVGLEQHVRTVHKGRPNNRICHHCGKGFPTKVQLESHIRTHTGERPFMCEYCPATFSQQSNLYKHHRQVHLNMKSKRYPLCKKPKVDGNQTDDPPPTFPIAIMQYVPENAFSF